MKKKSNGIIYIIVVLLIISLACGLIGLLNSLNKEEKPNNNKGDYKVTYKYYIDEEEVTTPVTQQIVKFNSEEFEGVVEEKELYSFDKYNCTNEVIGSWDNENWEFTPVLTADTTCRLYFTKNLHEVTINTVNAKLPSNNNTEKFLIEKEKNKIIKLVPTEGYKFDKIECNKKQSENSLIDLINSNFNEETKDLTLSNVLYDDVCTVSFKINDFTAEINVSNGSSTLKTQSANYGGTVTFEITPSENYVFDEVDCTNGQKAEYINGKLTIKALSNNTYCTVQFKPLKYAVNLQVINGTLLNNYSSPQMANDGGTVTFGISANNGFKLTGATLDCGNDKNILHNFQTGVLKIIEIKKDLNCKLTLQPESTE